MKRTPAPPMSPVASASLLLTLTHLDGSTTEIRVPEVEFDQFAPGAGVSLDFEPPPLLEDDFCSRHTRNALEGLMELPGLLSIKIKGRPVGDREHGTWGYVVRRGSRGF